MLTRSSACPKGCPCVTEDGGRSGTRTQDLRDSVLLVSSSTGRNGMEWTLLAARTESAHHNTALEAGGPWSAGEDPPLAMAKDPLGVLHPRDAGAPAAWGCWDAAGIGPSLPAQPRAQPHLSPAPWGSLLQRTALQLSLLPVCPGCSQESLGTMSFLHNHLHLEAAGMEPAPAQCWAHQDSSWLTAVPQTRALGHPQHPRHCLVGQTWRSLRAAECWAGQGLCGPN